MSIQDVDNFFDDFEKESSINYYDVIRNVIAKYTEREMPGSKFDAYVKVDKDLEMFSIMIHQTATGRIKVADFTYDELREFNEKSVTQKLDSTKFNPDLNDVLQYLILGYNKLPLGDKR